MKHQIEDYKDLHIKVFAAEGLSDTVVGTFERLQSMGFEVVPYLFIPWDIIPQDFDQFCLWLGKEVFDPIYEKQIEQDMPADGLVLEVNDYNWTDIVTNQYSNRQLIHVEHFSGNSALVLTNTLNALSSVSKNSKLFIVSASD